VDTVLLFIPTNKLTLMALSVAAAGIYFLFSGLHMFASRRASVRIPATTIRQASLGSVVLSGWANGPYTLSAPITGKPCFVYQTTVWQRPLGRTQKWEKVADEVLHLPFFVEDPTGQLLVEPVAADLDLHEDFRQEYANAFSAASVDGVPPRVSVFLARHGIGQGRRLRVEERIIAPQTPIFVAGELTKNPGVRLRPFSPQTEAARLKDLESAALAAAAENMQVPEIIHLSNGHKPSNTLVMTQQQKIAAALTRAGNAKPQAWAADGIPLETRPGHDGRQPNDPVPATAAVAGCEPVEDADSAESLPSLILTKGDGNGPFVISSRGQQEAVGGASCKSLAMVVGGAVLTALGVYGLLLEHTLR
jgi:E3 Ubiquitin ligase